MQKLLVQTLTASLDLELRGQECGSSAMQMLRWFPGRNRNFSWVGDFRTAILRLYSIDLLRYYEQLPIYME